MQRIRSRVCRWIGLCPLMACSPVLAQSWLAMPTAEPNVLFSVDEASLGRAGDTVKFWERLVFVQPRQRDEVTGRMVKEKRIHRIMNCGDKTQGHDFGSLVGEDGRNIETISINAADVRMTSVPSGTLAETEMLWACGQRLK